MLIIDCGKHVVIERRRDVDRKSNYFHAEFSFELKYGETVTKESYAREFLFTVTADKNFHPVWWEKLKDIQRDALLKELHSSLLHYWDLMEDLESAEEKPVGVGSTKESEVFAKVSNIHKQIAETILPGGAIPLLFDRLRLYGISKKAIKILEVK
jgi:hypothetical protein